MGMWDMDYQFSGEIITKEMEQYDTARLVWNRSINAYPKGIIVCKNVYDVCTAVNFIRSNNERCRILTRGHCSLGFGIDNDVYVIQLSGLNSCEYRPDYHMITSGCACHCGGICNTLAENQCFFPGPDPFSSIGVWSLCGGIGCSSRRYGLGCDYLAQVEMVDYRGEILVANQYQNQDLFWAIRGAGAGNFGVVTNLTYYLPEPVASVCYFEFHLDICTRSAMISFLEIWQDWIVTLNPDINCQAQFCNTFHSGRFIFGYGISYLSVEETQTCLGPFSIIKGLRITYESRSYQKVMNGLQRFFSPYERFNEMGRFVYDQYAMTDLELITDMIWGRRGEGSVFTSITLTGMGGYVSNYGRQDTAFFHRDARYLMSLKTQWFDEGCRESNNFWLMRQCDYLTSITRGGYINQPCPWYSNYEYEYYGENVSWLKEVKSHYDPYGFFNFPQGLNL